MILKMNSEVERQSVNAIYRAQQLQNNKKRIKRGALAGLSTIDSFFEQEINILKVLELYRILVIKDMIDVKEAAQMIQYFDRINRLLFGGSGSNFSNSKCKAGVNTFKHG